MLPATKITTPRLSAVVALLKAVHPVLTSTQQKVVPIDISIAVSIHAPAPIARYVDTVAAVDPVSHSGGSRSAAVPTSISSIVAINELIQLFVLAASSTTTLARSHCRQDCQQKQAYQNQSYLAIAFHRLHNVSRNPIC
jgi:hypothetical protein